MDTKELIEVLQKKYPHLAGSITLAEGEENMGELKFHNPRYSLWFIAEDNSYIVGIDYLHYHFDSDDYEFNLEEALEYIDDVINDRVVAIGEREKESDYMIARMSTEEGLKHYLHEKPKIEIVSFSKEY